MLVTKMMRKSKMKALKLSSLVFLTISSAFTHPISDVSTIFFSKREVPSLSEHWNTAGNNHPIVFIHGLMGWGEDKLLGIINYWGGVRMNILDLLRTTGGHIVHAPHLGPVSSNW
jgi:triacylglycerol lipase